MLPKLRIALAASVCSCLLTGCLHSLHPLCTEDAGIFRDELLGTWRNPSGPGPVTIDLKFESVDDEMYRMTVTSSESDLVYHATLVELGGHMYLDYRRDVSREYDEGNLVHLDTIPCHQFVRIRFEDECVVTEFLDETWLKNYLRRHPDELDHTFLHDQLLLTADTEELQQFVVAHAEDLEIAEERTWYRIDPDLAP